jgi:uncharacterized membrane protein
MISTLSHLLGWFSAALGAIQLIAPRRLLAAIGILPTGGRVALTRLIGVREWSVVPGLLSASLPVGWLAARVAGDVMDLALLIRAHGARDTRRGPISLAIAAVTAIGAVDLLSAVAARREQRARSGRGDAIVRSVTVARPAAELYAFWRNLENLPRVMPHLESVSADGGTRSHWVARGPMGSRVEWDAETTEDLPDQLIAWQSVDGSAVAHAGRVTFSPAPAGRGTEVRVEMTYSPPGGPIGSVVAALSGEEPGQQVADALRRFKQVMETGEPVISEATATGRKVLQHPGQPLREGEHVAIGVGAEPVGVAS